MRFLRAGVCTGRATDIRGRMMLCNIAGGIGLIGASGNTGIVFLIWSVATNGFGRFVAVANWILTVLFSSAERFTEMLTFAVFFHFVNDALMWQDWLFD